MSRHKNYFLVSNVKKPPFLTISIPKNEVNKVSDLDTALRASRQFPQDFSDYPIDFEYGGHPLSPSTLLSTLLPNRNQQVDIFFKIVPARVSRVHYGSNSSEFYTREDATIFTLSQKICSHFSLPLAEFKLLLSPNKPIDLHTSFKNFKPKDFILDVPNYVFIRVNIESQSPLTKNLVEKSLFVRKTALVFGLCVHAWLTDSVLSEKLADVRFSLNSNQIPRKTPIVEIANSGPLTIQAGKYFSVQNRSGVTFQFPNGQSLSQIFPVLMPIYLPRFFIAQSSRLPTDYIFFASEQNRELLSEGMYENSLETLTNFGRIQVTSPTIQVIVRGGKDPLKIENVSLLDRVFDLKQRIAGHGISFFEIQLFLDGAELDDEHYLSVLGFYDGIELQLHYRHPGLCRLYFRDSDGNEIILDQECRKRTSFDSIALFLTRGGYITDEEDKRIAFTYKDKPVLRRSIIDAEVRDVSERIQVIWVPPSLTVKFQGGKRTLDVSPGMTVGSALNVIRQEMDDGTDLVMTYHNEFLDEERCIFDINPDLDEPFIVAVRPDRPKSVPVIDSLSIGKF
jgi:hypothetical protein